MKSLILTGAVT